MKTVNMHKGLVVLVVISAVLLGGLGVVAAQDGPVPEASRAGGDDGVQYKKETEYDFDDDLVEGALVKPDGALVGGELHGKTSSLIKIRADFIPELIKSVEDL